MRKITEDLKNTVAANAHIKEVHFTADGHHHFNVHKHDKKLYAQVFRDTVIEKGKRIERVVPNLKSAVVETVSRKDIEDANVEKTSSDEGKTKK